MAETPSEARSRSTGSTSAASRRPLIARSNPLAASARATPRPMPRLPPVTNATFRLASGTKVLLLPGLIEERHVRFFPRDAPGQQSQLEQVIIAPHARFATRHLSARRD